MWTKILIKKELKQYVTYKNILEITSCILRHKPLSLLKFKHPISNGYSSMGFMTKDNEIYAIKNCKYIKVENYATLFQIENFSAIEDIDTFNYVEDNLDDYMIGLPYIINGNDNEKIVYIYKQNWERITKKSFIRIHSTLN